MNPRIIVIAAVILVASGAFVLKTAPAGRAADQSAASDVYVTLNAALDQLKDDFNAAAGKTRLVFVIGPSCGPCLRGLDDMNRAVGDMTRENPNLQAFVIHVPTLGANEGHASRAVRLMQGEDIRHYWDPEGTSGHVLQDALGIDVYAWDVWLVYGGDAVWSDGGLAEPAHWEHQLGGLPRETRLDAARFAAKVKTVLDGGGDD